MTASLLEGGRPHDPELTDRLAELEPTPFEGQVYRATRVTADPTAFSPNGGRWAPPSTYQSVPVLYTSFERDGALAEMTSWLAELIPQPTKPIMIHKLSVKAEQVVRLDQTILRELSVDLARFQARDYARPGESPPSRTQEIGAALAFLGVDGLIAPSARWQCENLILFDTQRFGFEVKAESAEAVDWRAWRSRLGGVPG